ncbi:mitochondrial aspartate-glutamate transporter agc1 [Coemansia sp. RSA 988]|nr:mitochondrial aspartate-glutamate transporter agc1 [Coemansia sp. RSA 988]
MSIFRTVFKFVHRKNLRVCTLASAAAAAPVSTTKEPATKATRLATSSTTETTHLPLATRTARVFVLSTTVNTDALVSIDALPATTDSALLNTPATPETPVFPADPALPDVPGSSDVEADPVASVKPTTAKADVSVQTTFIDKRASIASTVTVVAQKTFNFVETSATDYALGHTGLLDEHPIDLAEILEFEADASAQEQSPVSDCKDDIFGYVRGLEATLTPIAGYIEHQPVLSWRTRSSLVEWIVMEHRHLDLLPETLHLCVNLIDRCLSNYTVEVSEFLLIGSMCLFLAAKYEEPHYLVIADIVELFRGRISKDVLFGFERHILELLNYNLEWTGPLTFLQRISTADKYDTSIMTLAKYLAEESLIGQHFVGVPSSQVAATAYYLSLRLLRRGPWSRRHAFYAGYFESELIHLVGKLIELLPLPRRHLAVYEKYARKRYLYASEFVQMLLKTHTRKSLLCSMGADCSVGTKAQPNFKYINAA